MRKIWLALLVVVMSLAGGFAQAADPAWVRDGALADQAIAGLQRGGFLAAGPNASAIKKALAGAKKLFPGPTVVDGTAYVLTDGQAEATAALAEIKLRGKAKGEVVAIGNPYPVLGYILGAFYNETGKYSEALKTLDAGLALSPLPKDHLGSTVPDLLGERGVALIGLKRWKDALASYDAGLAIADLDKKVRAKLYRGRGYALEELNRLDEAEAAYKASLKLDPGNPIAQNELKYIAALRAGAKPVAGGIVTMGKGK